MTRKKIYLLLESLLCVFTTGTLAAVAVRMYIHGTAMQASGDLFYYIYTREKAGAALWNILPLIAVFITFTAAGWLMGIRDEKAELPVALEGMDEKQSVSRAVAQKTGRREKILRGVVFIFAIVMIFLGVQNGGLDDVFAKGASICTECIGLG